MKQLETPNETLQERGKLLIFFLPHNSRIENYLILD